MRSPRRRLQGRRHPGPRRPQRRVRPNSATDPSSSDSRLVERGAARRDLSQNPTRLFELMIPADSRLAGTHRSPTAGSAETFGLRVIGIARRGGSVYFPAPDEKFRQGDQLLVKGRRRSLELIRAIQSLELLDGEPDTAIAQGRRPTADGQAKSPSPRAAGLVGKTPARTRFPPPLRAGCPRDLAPRPRLPFPPPQHAPRVRRRPAALRPARPPSRRSPAIPDFLLLGTHRLRGDRTEAPGRKAMLAAGLMLAVVRRRCSPAGCRSPSPPSPVPR